MSKSEELLKNLEQNLPAVPVAPITPEVKQDREIEDDYNFSRETYKELVDKSNKAIDGMMELALQSEHPRAFEVLSNMLKNTSDMTDKLMALQKQKKEVKKKEKSEAQVGPTGSVTNNNVFLGSVTDLQKHLIAQTLEKNVTNAP
jgi:hypothetical protein